MAEYIEREAAIESIMSEPPDAHYPHWYADKIKAIPAADVAPVRHGLWIPFNESEISGFNPELAGCDYIAGYRCSECGTEAILDCNDQFVLSKYCHDCGAKMDLEASDGQA